MFYPVYVMRTKEQTRQKQQVKSAKMIIYTFGPLLAASLEPLAHPRHVASLNLFYRYYFGRCSS